MVSWQEGDVQTNGIRLHYYRSGGEGPPVVLLHGITDSGLCWPRVSQSLADRYDIIAVDARGHGKSEKPDDGKAYAREEHAKDVAGLIESLGLDKPAIVGHSMGSGTASELAATFPGLVGALVLEDPPWRRADEAVNAPTASREWAQRIAARKMLSREELLKQGQVEHPKWQEVEFPNWIDAKYQVSENVVGYITPTAFRWENLVEKFQAPALLITADPELEAIVTPEVAEKAKELYPQLEIAHIPGAGHNIRREQFDAYMQTVLDFLGKVYPAG